jgi:hypothetical protein
MPVAGEQYLDAAALETKDANYLQSDIKERLAKGPVSFIWYAQIAEKGDIIDDPRRLKEVHDVVPTPKDLCAHGNWSRGCSCHF